MCDNLLAVDYLVYGTEIDTFVHVEQFSGMHCVGKAIVTVRKIIWTHSQTPTHHNRILLYFPSERSHYIFDNFKQK